MPDRIITVTELNSYVRERLVSDALLRRVSVKGEISEFRVQAGSGHAYFTLKDEGSMISCVMWRSSVQLLRFIPAVGKKVLARGQISIYVPAGRYQFTVDAMSEEGRGDLYARFEQLKSRLELEGLFDIEHKKPIPYKVKTIGVATSLSGAAIRDIIKVSRARNPRVNILIVPCAVQGKGAEYEIARAVRRLDEDGRADVILVGRGGGSIEDLWPFNEEAVARAIYACRTPVISCVGHETDFSIADFVSDLRASTPSNAAEIAVADVRELEAQLRSLVTRLVNAFRSAQQTRRLRLTALTRSVLFRRPADVLIKPRREAAEELRTRLLNAQKQRLKAERIRLQNDFRVLETLNPDNIKKRGYACVRQRNALVSDIGELDNSQGVTVELLNGEFDADIKAVRRVHNG
ncbi:MAG: exodeoxyribonuclease VII large subunit [Clostridia bacterium]|nr:exodeoxyribonuclease VII large subunit [Clostridia bacterium]